jgi:hypothetical protein
MKNVILLSKEYKKWNITFLYKWLIIKYVNKSTFLRIWRLHNRLKIENVLHFYWFDKIQSDKYFLYYKKYEEAFKKTVRMDIFIGKIFLPILKLNFYNISINNEKLTKWYIQTDPNYRNFIIKNNEIVLIDLESIEYNIIILQPLSIFIKSLLGIKFNNIIVKIEYFKIIYDFFLSKEIFSNDFKKLGSNWIYLLYLNFLEKYNKHNKNEYYSALSFFVKEKHNIIDYFILKWIK